MSKYKNMEIPKQKHMKIQNIGISKYQIYGYRNIKYRVIGIFGILKYHKY